MTDELKLGVPESNTPSLLPAELMKPEEASTSAAFDMPHWSILIGLSVIGVLLIASAWSMLGSDRQSNNQAAAVVVLDPAPIQAKKSDHLELSDHSPNTFAPYRFIATDDSMRDDDPVSIDNLVGRKQIALVIDDLGLNQARTRAVADLGVPLTMSFLPYASNLHDQVTYARQREHDVFAHVPMEPMDPNANAGKNLLALGMGRAALEETLVKNLAPFAHLDGVNNHMGSRFTSDRDSMVWLVGNLQRRGLLFLDSRTTTETQGEKMALAAGLPGLRRHVFLDHERPSDPNEVRTQLLILEQEAQKRGIAVAIGHPHPATLNALRTWIPQARSQGFLFVRMRDVAAQLETTRVVLAP